MPTGKITLTLRVTTAWWLTPACTLLFAWSRLTGKLPSSKLTGLLISKAMRVRT